MSASESAREETAEAKGRGSWNSRHVNDRSDLEDDVDPLQEPPEKQGDEEVKDEEGSGEEGGLVG